MPKPEFKNQKELLDSIIRVNHAGEYGAMRIYMGQMAATNNPETRKIIFHMQQQEKKHLTFFEQEMKQRNVRPTILMPLWHYGAYALGFVTALMGQKTAMLCTQAVEEVIDEHYLDQITNLKDNEDEFQLTSKIKEFRLEELEHKVVAIEYGSMESPFYILIRKVIGCLCRGAIELSKR